MRLIILLLLAAFASDSLAQGQPWYLRAAVTSNELDARRTGANFFSSGFLGAGLDDSDQGGEFGVGYTVNDWLAFELSYSDLGESDFQFTCPTGVTCTPVEFGGSTELTAASFQAIFSYPLSQQWRLVGILGASRLEIDTEIFFSDFVLPNIPVGPDGFLLQPTSPIRNSQSETEARFGIGANWQFHPRWGLDVRAERLGDDIETYGLGLVFGF